MEQLPVGADPHGDSGSEPAPDQNRCAVHDLAAGPDGRCMLCRRAETPVRPESRRVWIIATLVLVLGLGPAALYFLYWRHHTTPSTPPSTEKTAHAGTDPQSDDPEGDDLKTLERLSRQADARRLAREARKRAATRAAGAAASPKGRSVNSRRNLELERAKAAAQAQRKAVDAQRAQAKRKQEQHAKGQANLQAAIRQVSITAYMADW